MLEDEVAEPLEDRTALVDWRPGPRRLGRPSAVDGRTSTYPRQHAFPQTTSAGMATRTVRTTDANSRSTDPPNATTSAACPVNAPS